MESILTSIKKLLGIAEEHTSFDADIIMHINSVFTVLTQLGVGPSRGFYISDSLPIWSDFVNRDDLPDGISYESVKSYMYMKVKLLFDPPASGTVTETYNRLINEFEWRLNFAAESRDS